MNEKDILKAVQKIAGRPMRIKIALGEPEQQRRAPLSTSRRTTYRSARSRIPKCGDFRRCSRTRRFAWCEI